MEIGSQTEELRPPAPPDSETRAEKLGRRCFAIGITTGVMWTMAAIIAAQLSDHNMYHSEDGDLYGTLGLFVGGSTSFALIVVGGVSMLLRPLWVQQRHLAGEMEKVNQRVVQLTHDSLERYDNIIGYLGVVPGRLDQFAERMDHGGKEYLERLEAVEAALAAFAEHLPDAMLSEHWRGFNEAVREGFAEQRNGTDGTGRRRNQHLGLVAPDQPES